jgi:hypothetical protein
MKILVDFSVLLIIIVYNLAKYFTQRPQRVKIGLKILRPLHDLLWLIQVRYIGLADKLRMMIFRCAAPLILILFNFTIKIIATLGLNFQVQPQKNVRGQAHR